MSCFKASQESAAIEAGCNSQLITGNEAGNTSVIDSVELDLVSINVHVKEDYMNKRTKVNSCEDCAN